MDTHMDTRPNKRGVIDCGIHNVLPSPAALLPFLPAQWQEYTTQSDLKGPTANLSFALRRAILAENARGFYRF